MIAKLLSVSLLPALFACSNTTVVCHKTALDINAEFTADLAKPVAFNAGYESHAGVAVPPKNSQGLRSLFNRRELPDGDVLSTVTAVKVERVPATDAVGNVAFDYIAAAATGKAAAAATNTTPSPPDAAGEEAEAATTTGATPMGDVAAAIVSDPDTVSPANAPATTP